MYDYMGVPNFWSIEPFLHIHEGETLVLSGLFLLPAAGDDAMKVRQFRY